MRASLPIFPCRHGHPKPAAYLGVGTADALTTEINFKFSKKTGLARGQKLRFKPIQNDDVLTIGARTLLQPFLQCRKSEFDFLGLQRPV